MSEIDDRVKEARLLSATGRPEEALAVAEEVLDQEPERLDALLLKAQILHEQGADQSALALYERAVRLAPLSPQAWNDRARCLHALAQDDEALAAARRARALLDDDAAHARLFAAVSLTLIWCLREKRLFREALAAAEECLLRAPDAVVAEWAGQIEQELEESERERC